ncbi:MAG: hypothetical protein KDJ62_12325 [Rhodobiaceae bacterium]|nr:hypothetical protein [Rhodobiaceae bacterium]
MTTQPTAFVLSYERPIFLWATLDSLWRNTKLGVRFVLLDNASQDPAVRQVIEGFDSRGMFDEIEWGTTNDPLRTQKAIAARRGDLGERFFFVENDVIVPDTVCWASEYEAIAAEDPKAGMIGSFCDPADFPDPEKVRALHPNSSSKEIAFLAKSNSPERSFILQPGMRVWPNPDQHPPGRLVRLSTEAIDRVGYCADRELGRRMRAVGLTTKVCTTFQHRHLSLLNAYDLNDEIYAEKRKAFFVAMNADDTPAGRYNRIAKIFQRGLRPIGRR